MNMTKESIRPTSSVSPPFAATAIGGLVKMLNGKTLNDDLKKDRRMLDLGRGYGAVGRAVAFDLWFDSQHRRCFANAYICQLQFRKDKNEKRGWELPV